MAVELLAIRIYEAVITNEQMNLLQNHSIISDLCITPDDIAEPDRSRAIDWLAKWRAVEKGELLPR